MINFMATYEFCNDYMRPIANLVKTIVDLIKWGIPVILIIFGMLDLGKAVMAGKEDEMKKAQGTLIKRVIYAVLVFLVVTIVMLVMKIVSDAQTKDGGYTEDWYTCIFENGEKKTQKKDGKCPDKTDKTDPDCTVD